MGPNVIDFEIFKTVVLNKYPCKYCKVYHTTLKQVMTAPQPNTLQQVGVSLVLRGDRNKRLDRITERVAH